MAMLFTAQLPQVDASGNPYSGAKLFFYQTGTTTAITTYQDSAATTPHASPVVANSKGEFAPVYVNTNIFKVVLKDSSDVTVRTIDPVNISADEMFGIAGDIKDDELLIVDPADGTKKVRFDAGGVSAGNTRVLTVPDANATIVGTDTTQNLENKTIIGGLQITEGSAPTTPANGVALYAKDNGTEPVAYIRRESNGAEIPVLGAWELIEATALSSQANYQRTGLSAYRMLRISGWMAPATDAETLIMRTSTNNGSTYDSGADHYDFQTLLGSNTTFTGTRSASSANLNISIANVGNDTGEMASFELLVTDFNKARYAMLAGKVTLINNSNAILGGTTHGRRLEAVARDAFQIKFSGNIASGFILVEGFRG